MIPPTTTKNHQNPLNSINFVHNITPWTRSVSDSSNPHDKNIKIPQIRSILTQKDMTCYWPFVFRLSPSQNCPQKQKPRGPKRKTWLNEGHRGLPRVTEGSPRVHRGFTEGSQRAHRGLPRVTEGLARVYRGFTEFFCKYSSFLFES